MKIELGNARLGLGKIINICYVLWGNQIFRSIHVSKEVSVMNMHDMVCLIIFLRIL